MSDLTFPGRRTRREFLLSSTAALASFSAPGIAKAAVRTVDDVPATSSFHSRPDLKPPLLAVESSGPTVAAGYVFSAPFIGQSHGTALISDNSSEPLWIYQTANLIMNFRAQTLGGKPVLTWWEGSVVEGLFEGDCVIADTSYRVVRRLSAGNGFRPEVHEFLITPQDTALISINNLVHADLTAYGGPSDGTVVEGVIQELDIATGRVLFEWHSLDHVDLEESGSPAGSLWDYFHLNSIDVDVDNNLVISARYPSAVYKLDRRTGTVIWRLGGTRSDFALGSGAAFWFQHDARCLGGSRVSIFDDGADAVEDAREPVSRALVLSLNIGAMAAELVSSIPNAHGSLTTAMGNAQRLAGGGCFVGWGTVPEISEFAPDGSLRFDATFPGGHSSYRAFRAPWRGQPGDEPAAASVRNANGSIDLYASWNGATEVSHWDVRGGATPAALTSLKTVARTGFETRVRITRRPAHVQAVALDNRGKVLGTSQTIAA